MADGVWLQGCVLVAPSAASSASHSGVAAQVSVAPERLRSTHCQSSFFTTASFVDVSLLGHSQQRQRAEITMSSGVTKHIKHPDSRSLFAFKQKPFIPREVYMAMSRVYVSWLGMSVR